MEILKMEAKAEDSEVFTPHRVFINNVDSFNGKHIASYLADRFFSQQSSPSTGEETPLMPEDRQPETEGTAAPALGVNDVRFEIIGTLSSKLSEKSEDVFRIIERTSPNFHEEIANCGVVIYDITKDEKCIPEATAALTYLVDQFNELKEKGPKTYANDKKTQTFILISTVMTWARIRKPRREYQKINDSHYKRRKSHESYKDHLKCERCVTFLGTKHPEKLKTYVLCTGFTYGQDEDSLSFLFELAWVGKEQLPIFGDGSNRIPLIHILDLAAIIYRLLKRSPSDISVILAVDTKSVKQKSIVTAIAKAYGNGLVRTVESASEAEMIPGVTSKIFEMFSIDLNMDPEFLSGELGFEWEYEGSLAEHIHKIVEELKTSRKLNPISIMIHGAPGAGKTRLARKLCEEYGLHYVNVGTLIEETIQQLRDEITQQKAKEMLKGEASGLEEEMFEEELGEEEEEERVDIEDLKDRIREIQSVITKSPDGRLPEEQVTHLCKNFLERNICQNRGFVLDNYPKNVKVAQELFGRGGDDMGEEEQSIDPFEEMQPTKITPRYVFSLQADEKFLRQRLKKNTPRDIEQRVNRKFAEFNESQQEEYTILDFFHELEIHPVIIDVAKDETASMDLIMQKIRQCIGPAVKFGLSVEEEIEQQRLADEALLREQKELESKKLAEEQEAEAAHQRKLVEWTDALQKLKEEEEKVLMAEREPIRNFLVEYIFPTLVVALTDVVKMQPDDPVDYVAEYLLRANPEGKMFDPTYSKQGEELLGYCEKVVGPTGE